MNTNLNILVVDDSANHRRSAELLLKGHTLTILDRNTPGPDKRPAPEIAKYGPFKPPELVIASLADGKILKREPCRFDAAFVMSELKANGG